MPKRTPIAAERITKRDLPHIVRVDGASPGSHPGAKAAVDPAVDAPAEGQPAGATLQGDRPSAVRLRGPRAAGHGYAVVDIVTADLSRDSRYDP